MFLLGGLCFVLIGLLNEVIPWEMPLPLQGVIGSAIVTALEFATGCIVNLWLDGMYGITATCRSISSAKSACRSACCGWWSPSLPWCWMIG